MLKGLEDAIGDLLPAPVPRRARLGASRGGEFTDDVNGFELPAPRPTTPADPDYDGRISVPVLWDKRRRAGSSPTSRPTSCAMLDAAWDESAEPGSTSTPSACARRSTSSTSGSTTTVNNGVYRAGFSRSQESYDERLRGAVRGALPARGSFSSSAATSPATSITRGRLAAVPDARALRRRLPHALPLQRPPDRRLPEPLGLHPRALPAAGRRGDGRAWTRSSATTTRRTTQLNPKHIIPRGPLDLDFTAPHGRG